MPSPRLDGGSGQALPRLAPTLAAPTLATLTAAAFAFLAVSALPAAAQQAYGDGPVVLRPPAGAQPYPSAIPGQTVSAGGSVVVNLNAIGGGAAAPGAAYPPLRGAGVPQRYFSRPPLPGEVPLVDEDPIVLRAPGPDGYGSATAGNRVTLRPPQQTASRPLPAIETRPVSEPAAGTAPSRPAAKPQPKPATQQAAARPAAPQPSPAPVLRSQVRGQDDSLAMAADKPMAEASAPSTPAKPATMTAAATPAPSTSAPSTSAPSTSTSGSGTPAASTSAASTSAASTSGAAAPSTPPPPSTPTPRTKPATVAATTTGSVTLPATSAPPRSEPTVPAPPTRTAPEAPQQTATATAPDRTLPAVPQAQGEPGGITIDFKSGEAVLSKGAEQQLATLAAGMKDGTDRLQIKAYAQAPESGSSSGARRLSLSLALSVRSYLIDQGIRSTRIDVRALGDTGSGSLDRVEISPSGRS
ncbi:MAG: OmpA family protein [Sneathiellaceae bacterium]